MTLNSVKAHAGVGHGKKEALRTRFDSEKSDHYLQNSFDYANFMRDNPIPPEA